MNETSKPSELPVKENRLYPEKYGAWAGNPQGQAPDHSRCCEEVVESGRWGRRAQCRRPRGYGPDEAYCKQHDPEAVKARRAASDARANAELNARRYQWNGKLFFEALEKIAAGHNDPRGLAAAIIADFKNGER